jgi:hypothetical protein
MYVRGYLQSSENGRVVTMALNRYYIIIDEVFFDNFLVIIYLLVTAGNRHKQNSWFCKEIREDNFRFWWRYVHVKN